MRTDLKRIEAMLAQLAHSHQEPLSAAPSAPAIVQRPSVPVLPQPSFDTKQRSQRSLRPAANAAVEAVQPDVTPKDAVPFNNAAPASRRSPGLSAGKMPTLPRFDAPRLGASDGSQAPARPALAGDLLQAIAGLTVGWQEELQQCLRQIQTVYAEGQIVDGWLEAYAAGSQDAQTVRSVKISVPVTEPFNAVIDQEVKNLDQLRQAGDRARSSIYPAGIDPAIGCRLCGLHDDGQLWFCHCPAEQVAVVSLAIARCERIKHLLTRKQHLETKLAELTETLTVVYEHLTSGT